MERCPASNQDERRFFLRDGIWNESGAVLNDKESRRFEEVVQIALGKIDLANLNKDQLLVAVYDFMKEQGFEERDVNLFLCLFDRKLNVLKAIEEKREELLLALKDELEEQKRIMDPEERDEELIGQINREIEILTKGNRSKIYAVMQDYSETKPHLDKAEKKKSPFDGPFVRGLIGSQKGNRRYTDKLKKQLATLFRTSEQAIAAMKAWKSGELNGRSAMTENVIEKTRLQLEGIKPNAAYEFISDPEDKAFAKSLEPKSFKFGKKGVINREQRKWIYALMLLGPKDEAEKQALRKTLAENVFKCSLSKVSAVTAYLSGKLYEKEKANKGNRWKDIEQIEEYKRQKEKRAETAIEVVKDRTLAKEPNYDNPAKEKGYRDPECEMVERVWGKNNPLRGKRIMLLETPALHEWKRLEKLGAEERLLTIVEEDRERAARMAESVPKAQVVAKNLFEHLADETEVRLNKAGISKQWEAFGVNSKNPRSYVRSPREFWSPISLNPASFKGLKIPRIPSHTFRRNNVEIPKDPEKKFDLISFDAIREFSSEADTLVLLFKLGLLGHNSILCTNFFAMREDVSAQMFYRSRVLLQRQMDQAQAFKGDGYWEGRAMQDLMAARGDAISLELLSIIKKGRDQGRACTANNPFSLYYTSLIDRISQVQPQTMLEILDHIQKHIHLPIAKEAMEKLPEQERQKIYSQVENYIFDLLFESIMNDIFESECINVFSKLELFKTSRLRKKIYPKGNPKRYIRSTDGTPSDSILGRNFPAFLTPILLAHLHSQMSVVHHTSYGYFNSSKMNSDFFHLRDPIRELGIPHDLLKNLLNMLFNNPRSKFSVKGLMAHIKEGVSIFNVREAGIKHAINRNEV